MKKHWKPIVLALLTMLLVCTCMSAMADTTPQSTETSQIQHVESHATEERKEIVRHHSGQNNYNAKEIETLWCKDCGRALDVKVNETAYEACSFKFTKLVAPTCTEKGYDLYTCEHCGQTKKENETPKVAHVVSAYKVTKAATCVAAGSEEGFCSSCKQTIKREIPLTGHNYQEDNKPATCTEPGYTSQKCQNCGDVINKVVIGVVNHSLDDNAWVVNHQPTCTEKGTKTNKCQTCGALITKDVPATGHTMKWELTTKATCAKGSIETYTCSQCGLTRGTRTGEPLNHQVAWKKSKELSVAATCTTDGKDVTVCSACGEVMKEEKVNKLNHVKDGESQIQYHAEKPATCTEQGNSEYKECKLCGKVTGGSKVIYAALGHKFENQVVITPASCTQPGQAETACSRTGCGEKETVVIPAKGHVHFDADANWNIVTEATCYSTGIEVNVCKRCGGDTKTREIPKKEHQFATGAQVKSNNNLAANITGWGCTTDGTATVYCQYNCGESTTVTVPAKGHVWGDWTYDRNAPDCTHSMNATRKCVRGDCDGIGAVETKQIAPAWGHSFEKNDPRNVAATCTTDGLLFGECTVCHQPIVGQKIPATGHKPVEIVVSKPSPSGAGLTETRCSVCNELLSSKKIPYTDVRYNSFITGFGPTTRELVGGSAWNRVTPIDLNAQGTQTFDLIASNKYVVGTMTVTVANGTLTVSYKLNSAQIDVSSEVLKIYDNVDALRTGTAKAYVPGMPIDIASTFGEDSHVILSLTLTATYDAAGSGVYGFTQNDTLLAAMSGLLD